MLGKMGKYLTKKSHKEETDRFETWENTSSENSLIIEHFKHNTCTGFKTDR
jgi:hypothetical protein